MTDYSELKRLAEAFPADLDWDSNTEPFFNGPSGESLGGGSTGFYCVYGKPFSIDDEEYDGPTFVEVCNVDFAKFMVEARQGVLDLIAENERLTHHCGMYGLELANAVERRTKALLERDLFRAEIDEDKLHFSAMGKTVEDLVAERNQLKAELLEESMMSECMRQFRADMIKLGVVGESCPPMMMTEGVLGYIEKLKAECEGLRKDAARYWWLRRNQQVEVWEYFSRIGEDFRDDVIDEAIKKEAEFPSGKGAGNAKQS